MNCRHDIQTMYRTARSDETRLRVRCSWGEYGMLHPVGGVALNIILRNFCSTSGAAIGLGPLPNERACSPAARHRNDVSHNLTTPIAQPGVTTPSSSGNLHPAISEFPQFAGVSANPAYNPCSTPNA